MKKLALTLALLLMSLSAVAEVTVKEFRGEANTTTAAFTVEEPWLLDWNLASDYNKFIALEITLIEAHTGRHVGRVLRRQSKGNGLVLFDDPGTYRLRISSSYARWTIKIKQIQPEEKDRYTPKEPSV